MIPPRRQPTQWERKFFAGDSSALDEMAAKVQDLKASVLSLVTGDEPWEFEALTLISQIQRDYQQAERAFGNGDLLACTEYVVNGITPKTSQLTALLRKVLTEEFPVA